MQIDERKMLKQDLFFKSFWDAFLWEHGYVAAGRTGIGYDTLSQLMSLSIDGRCVDYF